jgi:hypothetical protein
MPILPGTAEMNELAQKLTKMKFNRAKGAIRRMDKKVHIELYRTSVGTGQLITRFALPTRGMWITLVERQEEYGQPNRRGYRKMRFKYVEARVEPLPDSARNDHLRNPAEQVR